MRIESTEEVTRLLRAELAARHIALCDTADPNAPPPIATVSANIGEATAVVRVEVHDSVTRKALTRDVPLDTLARDTHPLTVALAADELLRASWAEIALASSAPLDAPAEVVATVRETLKPEPAMAHPPRAALGAAAAIDAFGTGTVFLGADLVAGLWLVPRVRIDVRFGARSALTESGPDGSVAATALVGKLGALVTLTSPARAFGLDVLARVGFMRASFVPTPTANAVGTPSTDVAIVGEAAAQGWVRLASALRLSVSAGPSVAFRPVRITDGAREIGGIDGAGVVTSLDLMGIF